MLKQIKTARKMNANKALLMAKNSTGLMRMDEDGMRWPIFNGQKNEIKIHTLLYERNHQSSRCSKHLFYLFYFEYLFLLLFLPQFVAQCLLVFSFPFRKYHLWNDLFHWLWNTIQTRFQVVFRWKKGVLLEKKKFNIKKNWKSINRLFQSKIIFVFFTGNFSCLVLFFTADHLGKINDYRWIFSVWFNLVILVGFFFWPHHLTYKSVGFFFKTDH